MALFPEFVEPKFSGHVLHLFSGSLPPGNYERCDEVQDAELPVSVYELPNIVLNYRPRLILADPPYSAADAEKYGTVMVNRGRVFRTLAQVTDPGAFVVWLGHDLADAPEGGVADGQAHHARAVDEPPGAAGVDLRARRDVMHIERPTHCRTCGGVLTVRDERLEPIRPAHQRVVPAQGTDGLDRGGLMDSAAASRMTTKEAQTWTA